MALSAELDDRALMASVSRGEARGLEALYDRHAALVYALALRIVRDAGEAEDVTQDVFAQVWTSGARYDASRGSVGAWLTVIARSRALDRVRRRRAALKSPAPQGELPDIPDPGPSVELMAATAEQATSARQALEALPVEQRHVLELAYFEGLSQREIATQTDMPLGTIKTRIRTGLQRIRDAVVGTAPARRREP